MEPRHRPGFFHPGRSAIWIVLSAEPPPSHRSAAPGRDAGHAPASRWRCCRHGAAWPRLWAAPRGHLGGRAGLGVVGLRGIAVDQRLSPAHRGLDPVASPRLREPGRLRGDRSTVAAGCRGPGGCHRRRVSLRRRVCGWHGCPVGSWDGTGMALGGIPRWRGSRGSPGRSGGSTSCRCRQQRRSRWLGACGSRSLARRTRHRGYRASRGRRCGCGDEWLVACCPVHRLCGRRSNWQGVGGGPGCALGAHPNRRSTAEHEPLSWRQRLGPRPACLRPPRRPRLVPGARRSRAGLAFTAARLGATHAGLRPGAGSASAPGLHASS